MSDILLLRADAGGAVGSGHVMRLVALGEAWIDSGGACVLASHDLPEPLAQRLRETPGFQVSPIAARSWTAADAAETLALGARFGACAAAVDSYFTDGAYLAALETANLRTLFVDDVARLAHYPCSLLANQNLAAAETLYAGKALGTRLLLGPQYVMLRREFRTTRGRIRTIGSTANRLLATFGGVDPKNASAIALKALALAPEIEAELIVGAANPNAKILAEQAAPLKNVTLVHDARDMAQRIAGTEMILSAGGTTIWEAAVLGAPMMLVASAPEEEAVATRMTRDGGLYLGRVETLTPVGLANAIRSFAGDLAARARSTVVGRAMIDGLGAERVAAALRQAAGH